MPRRHRSFDDRYAGCPPGLVERLVRFRVEHPWKHAVFGGVEWSYRVSGHGPETMLLLPGVAGTDMAFPVIEALESEYRIIAPAFPTVHAPARWIDGLVSILNREYVARAHVVAGSIAGLLAQVVVRRHPERVATLVLSHAVVPSGSSGPVAELLLRILPLVPAPVLRWAVGARLRGVLRPAPDQARFWRALLTESLGTQSRAELTSTIRMVYRWADQQRFSASDLDGWPGRILIIGSDDDPFAPPERQASLHALYPRAETHTFHGTGHDTSLAAHERWLDLVRGFLRP